ncbi:MAG TPA: hypothetical protein VHZ24_22640 [Pirellulales bacterium]|jgi:uncharacterized membrane protein HdeD (DUF308 family)|nr:hypothetical protein [Pirellulales bacterium]
MRSNRIILLIAAGVLAWGVYQAWGAYRLNHNPWRFVMVLGCTLAFLGFWAAMLAARQRRLDRERRQGE